MLAAFGVAVVVLGVLGFLPLVAGPGYEAALASGLVLPVLAAVGTAVEIAPHRLPPSRALARGAASGGLMAALGLLVTLAHGARAGFCDPIEGTAYFTLGPGVGAVLAGVWGAGVGTLVGEARTRRRLVWKAGTVAALGPAATAAVSLYRFYSSPMVFAFDPFVGFFAGALYDTVIDVLGRLATYRLGTACTVLAVGAASRRLAWRGEALVWTGTDGPTGIVVGLAGLAGSVGVTLAGPELGHWQTTQTVRSALGRHVAGRRCDVTYDSAIPDRDAELLARDCDGHVEELERYFEIAGKERVEVFLFASAGQKGELIGAAETSLAKPWRREVYLQAAAFPHPVLGHELAHVVAGSFGRGPFRVAGPLAGLVPDPGRIEGLAVAASPRWDDDLTLQQWARTMLDLDLLPELSAIFRLSFFGEPSSKGYTVAGAFVSWLHERYGARAVKEWYGGGPLDEATGKPLSVLQAEWTTSLAEVDVPPRAMAVARARFDRPALFGRRCPHTVDRWSREAASRLGVLDHRGAREAFERVLALDPRDARARLGLGRCAMQRGATADGRRAFRDVAADADLAKATRARAEEILADLDLARGAVEKAAARYDRVSKVVVDEDRLRAIEVKRTAVDSIARSAVVSLLIGDPRRGPDPVEAAARLGRWAHARPRDGTPEYLLGKNLWNRGRWAEAAEHLDRALSEGKRLRSDRVRREALRTRFVVACARQNRATAAKVLERWSKEPDVSAARRAGFLRLARRCGATGSSISRP